MSQLRYDNCTYSTDLRQSVGPGQYLLGTPWPNCSPCHQTDTRIQLGTGGVSICGPPQQRPMIDVESELYNITRPASGCPARNFMPPLDKNGAPRPFCTLQAQPDCRETNLPTEDTRLNNPPCTLRGTGWNRWEWLCQDPQEKALVSFDTMVDTAIVAKDNHRPHLACPLDQTMALPADAHSPAAMAIDAPPAWATSALHCAQQANARVGNGIGADGATPILSFRGCDEVQRLQRGPGSACV